MRGSAYLLSLMFCLLSIGCGAQRHVEQTFTPTSAPTLPPFGSGHDEEHAQAVAEAVVQNRPKRHHPRERFAVVTEAYSNTRTRYYDTAQGVMIGPGMPRSENLDHEVKLVLELGPDHTLRVASYEERAIDVPPPREEP
jgi:hypothetical protein